MPTETTTKLNQIIAIEAGIKNKTERDLTTAYQRIQATPLLSGIARTYQPRDDDGDQLPSESQVVQVNAEQALKDAVLSLTRLFDVTLTKEETNAQAKADVVVNGVALLTDVPVTYLLFLEKRVTDIRTAISKLPVLDPAKRWVWDENAQAWASEAVQTVKTKKVPRVQVLYEATDKHPAQVQAYNEDVVVGDWTTIHFSGNVDGRRKAELLDRADRLLNAVKFAREEANTRTVIDREAGAEIFGYLFGE